MNSDPLGPEFRLIDRLCARLGAPAPGSGLLVGAGDDASVWRLPSGELGLYTVDTLVEGIHAFPHEPPEAVGARALTGAVSDIVAMGGEALLALIALQVPPGRSAGSLEKMYDGIAEEAAALGVAVTGGDVVDTEGPLALAVAVFGTCTGEPWLRSGARAGDRLAVTGALGGSRAGLELLGRPGPDRGAWADRLIERHLRPRARTDLVSILRGTPGVHAAIDISDGLSSEAWHLALSSDCVLRLDPETLPVHPDLDAFLAWRETDAGPCAASDYLLDSGEEYELLLSIAPNSPLLSEQGGDGARLLHHVGRVEAGEPAVFLERDGESIRLAAGGHSHTEGIT